MIAFGHLGPRMLCDDDAIVKFETKVPEVRETDVLVRVSYVGMNALDAKLRATAKATADQPRILGFEGVGHIETVGSSVRDFVPGDRVAWLGQIDRPGATAEFTCVDHRLAALVPDSVASRDAAAMPMAYVTAYGLLINKMGLGQDQSGVLVIVNGAGGVGSAAIQIARQMTNMTIIATASRDETREWCRFMGAHEVISHRGNISDNLKNAGYRSVTAIASLTNTQTNFPDLLKRLAPNGTLGIIDQPASINAALLRSKAQRLAFEGAFVPSLMQPEAMRGQSAALEKMLGWMSDGTFQSIRYSAVDNISTGVLKEAHRKIEAQSGVGKTVLKVSRAHML